MSLLRYKRLLATPLLMYYQGANHVSLPAPEMCVVACTKPGIARMGMLLYKESEMQIQKARLACM